MDFKLQGEGEDEAEEAITTEPTETEPKTETKEETAETKKELKKKKEEEEKEPKKKDEDEEMKESLSAYTQFIKKYIKAHKGATIKDAAAAWKKQHEEVELAEQNEQLLKAIETVLEHLKKKKDKEEYPEGKYPYKKSEMENEALKAKNLQIKELSERVEGLEAKLSEPDRVAVKADGSMTEMLTEYSEEAFIKYLADQQQIIEV